LKLKWRRLLLAKYQVSLRLLTMNSCRKHSRVLAVAVAGVVLVIHDLLHGPARADLPRVFSSIWTPLERR
jgi:hypothetical protein